MATPAERPCLYLDVSYSDGTYEIVDGGDNVDLVVNNIDESRREGGDGILPCLACSLDQIRGHLAQIEEIARHIGVADHTHGAARIGRQTAPEGPGA